MNQQQNGEMNQQQNAEMNQKPIAEMLSSNRTTIKLIGK